MTVATGSFTLSRSFKVSKDRLWHLLTDPEARQAWGAPSDEMVLEIDKADLREDGEDRHRCGPKDNPEFIVDTRWYRLAGPDVAAFTETLIFQGQRASVSLVSYALTGDDANSAVTIEVSVTSFEGPEMIGEHEHGWTGALDRLQRQTDSLPA